MSSELKLGIHECSYIDCFSDDRIDFFPFLKECGFSHVEFSVLSNHQASRAALLKARLADNGLRATCCSCLPEGASFVNGDTAAYNAGLDYIKTCVDFCSAVGSELMSGILYSGWGCTDMHIAREKKLELAAAALSKAADYAADHGVTLCLEVLNRYESDYINTLDEGSRFLEMIGRSNVKLLADIFHMNIEETNTADAIKKNISSIGNIHISENNRDFPGYGAFDWQSIIKAIKESGYNGNITYECATMSGTEVGGAFNVWRSCSTDSNLMKRLSNSAALIKNLL